ncbi:MAG: hypothetical protein RQ756_07735 [Flavobacteriaceae bacterium]|nr:hypothetical protein [Flavobacteriaceae bacterium]
MTALEITQLSTSSLYGEFGRYFRIEEWYSPAAVEKYRHLGVNFFWSRIDRRLIETMLWIRVNKNQKIRVNNWLWGGRFTQRGVRDSSTPMMKSRATKGDAWLSAHPLSMGVDYDVDGETAVEHREWLVSVADQLPYPIRLERNYGGTPISWVHLDVCDDPKNPKVYLFDI